MYCVCVVFVDISRVLWVAFYADVWVYPVLLILGWPARIVFMMVCWLFMFACYFTGEFVTSFLWRECYILLVSESFLVLKLCSLVHLQCSVILLYKSCLLTVHRN